MGVISNKSRTGMTNSPEMRRNISLGLRGNKCGLGNKSRTGQKRTAEEIAKGIATYKARGHRKSDRFKIYMSELMKGHPVSQKTREAVSRTWKGRRHSEETKVKIRASSCKGCTRTVEFKRNLSEKNKGKTISMETREKIRRALLLKRDVLVENGKKAWGCPSKVESMMGNMLRSRLKKPNRLEASIISLLDRHFPNEWQYVGNGRLIIGSKCPDFARNHGNNQLLEIYGDYWHRGEDPQDRIGYFRNFGYDTLVIWEHQLKCMSEFEFVDVVTSFMAQIVVGRRRRKTLTAPTASMVR